MLHDLTLPTAAGRSSHVAGAVMPLAQIRIFDRLAAAEPHWRALEEHGTSTPYQRFDFLAPWQRHVGEAVGVTPHIVVGFDASGRAAVVMPLGVARCGPARVASFLGGTHANYNVPLWRADAAARFDPAGVRRLLDAAMAPVDALRLDRQPFAWNGLANPLRLLPHRPSPHAGWFATLDPDPDAQLARLMSRETRRKLRGKARKLAALPGFRYQVATTVDAVTRALDAFLADKAAQLRATGQENPFDEPGMVDFLRTIATDGLAEGHPLLECHMLACDDEVIAVNALIRDPQRTTAMLLSITQSENARWSPGALLLGDVVAALCRAGVKAFDLGVGESAYKRWFCDQPEALFDIRLARTPAGALFLATDATVSFLRRSVKRSPLAFRLARAFRRRLRGGAG